MLSALICFDFDRLVVPDNVSCIQAGAKQFARDSGANMGFSGTGLTAGEKPFSASVFCFFGEVERKLLHSPLKRTVSHKGIESTPFKRSAEAAFCDSVQVVSDSLAFAFVSGENSVKNGVKIALVFAFFAVVAFEVTLCVVHDIALNF